MFWGPRKQKTKMTGTMSGFLGPARCVYYVGRSDDQINNCYNYALDECWGDYKQPGCGYWWTMLFGQTGDKKNSTEDGLRTNLVRDGLEFLGKDYVTASRECGQGRLIACVKSDDDFHFYRREPNNTWTHKRGQKSPQDTDDAGHTILYVENCVNNYPTFVGYFCKNKKWMTW